MKQVPFYGNHEDNMHCMLAVYRSILEYFLNEKFDWTAIEGLAEYKQGKASWSIIPLPKMKAMGLDVKMIEPFDYGRFFKEGDNYLRTIYSQVQIAWFEKYTNISELNKYIPKFLKYIDYEPRMAELDDIDTMLSEGRLVFLTVNSRVLTGEKGFVSHALLVIDKNDDSYVVHNPGFPAQAYQHISRNLLWQSMGGDNNLAEVTGFKKKDELSRADILVANKYPLYSRSALSKLFATGLVRKDNKIVKPGNKLPANTILDVDISLLEKHIEDIDVPVLYEDDDCIVINKPSGVLSHSPGRIVIEPSVATFLRNKLQNISGQRSGIVHRLDRATSGVMICAKNAKAMSFLQKQFDEHKVCKTYLAIVIGHITPKEAIIDMPIERNPKAPATFRVGPNGKSARTRYKIVSRGKLNDLVELKPETGRTHQLRVHLAKYGHPIVGDPLYGKANYGDRLLLHAESLGITIPSGEYKIFKSTPPREFTDFYNE